MGESMKKVMFLCVMVYCVLMVSGYCKVDSKTQLSWTRKVEKFVSHTVVSGDTLDKIARLYRTTKLKILSKNEGIVSQELKVGKKLKVPLSNYQEKLIL